jgi:four helix bundle protein
MQPSNSGNLLAQDFATSAIERLRPLVERIARRDRGLADQVRRAATSVVLHLAEGAYNAGGHRRARFESGSWTCGRSANEAHCGAALRVAPAWGYVAEPEARELDALYDRVLAMTYKLWLRA